MRQTLIRMIALAGLFASPAALADDVPRPAPDRSTVPEPDYLDDRSTPDAVIRSLYNAIDRKEYARAWSYFRDEPDRPDFATFAKGYADTAKVELRLGKATSEGAAGSVYTSLPLALRSTDTGGRRQVFTGCYQLRLVQPAAQIEPPFRPLGIVKGKLSASDASFENATGTCPPGGL